MAANCAIPSVSDWGVGDEVGDILNQLQGDIREWGGNTTSALQDLETALAGLGDAEVGYNFSPNVNLAPTTFNYTLPNLAPDFSFTPQDIPEYEGPTSFDVNLPGSFSHSPVSPIGAITPYVFSPPEEPGDMAVPPPPPPVNITFNPPTGEPDGTLSDVAPYNAPSPFSPDIDVLKLPTSVTAPPFAGVLISPTNIPGAPPIAVPTVADPDNPWIHSPADITWQDPGDKPVWDGEKPELNFGGEPGDFEGSDPPPPPVITPVVMPDYSGPDDPTEPVLADITIPTIRDVKLPSFDIPVADSDIPTLTAGLNYNDPGYSDSQIDELRTEISRVLNGDLGIPAHLWDAIWDKAGMQIHREGVARERQGRQAWAKLGWSMPGGVALAQAEQAAQDINQQLSEKARELAIQRATMEREDFWNAVQHGTAFQKVLIDSYHAFQERQLRAEIALVEAMVSIQNAHVARYNAELQRTQSLIAVTELQLKGALATLDVDRAKLDGAKVTAEVNQQLTQIYTAQWEGVKAAVQKYATLVDAKKTELDAQRLRVEVFSELVKSRMTEVEAWAKEWDGYVAKVEGQKAKAQVYDIEARAFSERMKGYGIGADAEKARIDASVQAEKLQLENSSLQLQKYATDWQGVATKLDTASKTINARVQAYGTEAQTTAAQNSNQVEGEKAKVSAYGAEVQAFSAEMSAIGQRAQAIASMFSSEAERYRAESQGAMSEVQASAEVVKAEATAIDAQARAYTAKIEGSKAEMEGDIQSAQMDLEVYKTRADVAKTNADAEIAIYNGLLKGEEIQASIKQTEAQTLTSKAQAESEVVRAEASAYSAEVSAVQAANQAQASIAQTHASVLSAKAAVAEANSRSEATRIDAEAKLTDAKVRAALGDAEVDKLRVQSAAINLEAEIKRAELEQQAMIENAKLALQKLISMTEVQVQGLQGIAQTYATLCSGAYSAANVSASISASTSKSASQSKSCSESHSYSYEVA